MDQDRHSIHTGIPFFDHMLSLLAHHSSMDLSLKAKGDLHVDHHHTVEDVGICLGDGIRKALGEAKGINRYGMAFTPMDETLASVALDLSDETLPRLSCETEKGENRDLRSRTGRGVLQGPV